MSRYKMLALDMDGTLLTDDKEISVETARALEHAARSGVVCVLSTGRAASELQDYADELHMVRYGVLLSGAEVKDLSRNRSLTCRPLRSGDVRTVVAQGLAEHAMVQVFTTEGAIMTRSDVERMPEIGQGAYQDLARRRGTLVDAVGPFVEEHEDEILKINLHHTDRASLRRSQRALSSLDVTRAAGESASIEVTAAGVT